jgi:putative transposase
MYDWRKMSQAQREEALLERVRLRHPLHTPPHSPADVPRLYHLTAACYEHRPIIGRSPARMAAFEAELTGTLTSGGSALRVWCVLPNHWHALVLVGDLEGMVRTIGRLHGRTSRAWNVDDECPGRTCWHGCADRAMRNEAHVHATVNYILHNAVHHGYVERWQDWPYSNAREYLGEVGEEEAARRWKAYPLRDYGKTWDDPGMCAGKRAWT